MPRRWWVRGEALDGVEREGDAVADALIGQPELAQRGHERTPGLRTIVRPVESRGQVRPLDIHRPDPLGCAREHPVPLLREIDRPREVGVPGGVAFAGIEQASERERADRFQHPVPAGHVVEHHQALVDESGDDVEHRVGVDVVERSQHRLGAFQGEPADEYSETTQRGALLVVEQGFAPRDGCEERLLPGQERPGAAREQPEPVVELGGDPFG